MNHMIIDIFIRKLAERYGLKQRLLFPVFFAKPRHYIRKASEYLSGLKRKRRKKVNCFSYVQQEIPFVFGVQAELF